MAQAQPQSTDLTAQYAAQVSADLEHNAKEQDRISAELAALQGQLEDLQRDHTVLVAMRHALTDQIPAAPQAEHQPAPGTSEPKRKAAKSAPAGKAKASATRTGRKASVAGSAARRDTSAQEAAQPTLGTLIRDHLTQQSEPRSTAEITETLAQTHPDRGVKATVVRTTVEGLVAKGHVQRQKQGSSVFYTTSTTATDEQTAPTADTAPEQDGQAGEPAAASQ